MIEIKATGKCMGCPCMDPRVSRLFDGDGGTLTFASCDNSELCARLEAHLENFIRGEFAADRSPTIEDLDI